MFPSVVPHTQFVQIYAPGRAALTKCTRRLSMCSLTFETLTAWPPYYSFSFFEGLEKPEILGFGDSAGT